MDDRERRELQRLRDKFLEIMRRENDVTLFDEDAKQRVGEVISRSARPRPLRVLLQQRPERTAMILSASKRSGLCFNQHSRRLRVQIFRP